MTQVLLHDTDTFG